MMIMIVKYHARQYGELEFPVQVTPYREGIENVCKTLWNGAESVCVAPHKLDIPFRYGLNERLPLR